jgi:flagellar biosynthesis component FlhA
MMTQTDKIVTTVMTCQIALNQLSDFKDSRFFNQSLKYRLNETIKELIKVEQEWYDKFYDSMEDSTSQIYTVYENFLKSVSKIPIYDMENICKIIDAYNKDSKSIEGIVKKVLS